MFPIELPKGQFGKIILDNKIINREFKKILKN